MKHRTGEFIRETTITLIKCDGIYSPQIAGKGCICACTSVSVSYNAICGHKGTRKRNFRNHTLSGQRKTGSSMKHTIYGIRGWEKGGVSETAPHVEGAKCHRCKDAIDGHM